MLARMDRDPFFHGHRSYKHFLDLLEVWKVWGTCLVMNCQVQMDLFTGNGKIEPKKVPQSVCIPDDLICPFWYTATLCRPEKSA